ncbi:retrovirus-related pol polyprotein from transposon TNT 1-94 [Tanacetum coccineum]|uniref:Retrovirus-related pol polyprotein from transposon TNT 1-94 n=1 Tax=Tanacetum coccineum TaxID=301880 RepID=A0ABQ4WX25_9ASTR
MAKASSSQAWFWHRHLSHLNFDTINLLSKNDIVNGLPKVNFVKDHLFYSCELGKAKRKSFKTKTTPSSKGRLQLLHMNLCGPMRVESINGKKYVLVIVDESKRYTWTHFLRSKDETPEVLIDFLKLVQRGLYAQNRTLVEAARTMLSAAKVPLFFWAKAIATTCFTQNRSLIILSFDEYFNGATSVVLKSFAVPTIDAFDKRQQTSTTPSTSTTVAADTTQLDIQTTLEPTTQAPTVTTTKNIYQAENELVNRTLCKNVINMKWIWKNKHYEENTVIRNKACTVAKGYSQAEGIDFEESSAPVTRL